MTELEKLEDVFINKIGMDKESFALSVPYWQLKHYKKGEFYNEYKNICKHLGFIINGVFRIYRIDENTGEERNMLFFGNNEFIASYKSFLSQTACSYFTESMMDSTILYIHIDSLNMLYQQSHKWERFGRMVAEQAFQAVMDATEGLLFRSAEERYAELLKQHPDIFNVVPLYHIASYLGIKGPSLSRIRKRMMSQ
ncbi:Crp/Fnr family transcriptional regulator [Mucilaginibacter sp.]|jgi:CRP-like cAMP-binding protein|uniref:Crp/Fnr family transcriptional regulator n=1 Tax=Mucilaginibacter sp. TaxID=1882438 RepID=UPI0035687EC0